ncbi:hypothetical protein [Nonomuraea ceibae]|uniref:hypothetical protein n=1 Tax=Nonomuraea ceibae TaxID=1935170 RepID=UPI001C5D7E56|nr:hypothetical protein [Nonomuraea ceibae]
MGAQPPARDPPRAGEQEAALQPPGTRRCSIRQRSHLRLEFVYRNADGQPSATLGDLAAFVETARRIGAADATQLENACDMPEGEPYGWRVETDDAQRASAPDRNVSLPVALATHLFQFVGAIADGDGDTRGIVEEAADLRRHLLHVLLREQLDLDEDSVPQPRPGRP